MNVHWQREAEAEAEEELGRKRGLNGRILQYKTRENHKRPPQVAKRNQINANS